MLIPHSRALLKMNLHPVRAALPQTDLGDVIIDTSPAPVIPTDEDSDIPTPQSTAAAENAKESNTPEPSVVTDEILPPTSTTAPLVDSSATTSVSEAVATVTGTPDNAGIEGDRSWPSSSPLPWPTTLALNILVILLSVSVLTIGAFYLRRMYRRRKHRALLLESTTHPSTDSTNSQFQNLDSMPPTHAPSSTRSGGAKGRVSSLAGKLKLGTLGKDRKTSAERNKGHVRWGSDETWSAEEKSIEEGRDVVGGRRMSEDETWESRGLRRGMGAHEL